MAETKVEFSTSQMLKWMEYVADMKGVSPEKIKLLHTMHIHQFVQLYKLLPAKSKS